MGFDDLNTWDEGVGPTPFVPCLQTLLPGQDRTPFHSLFLSPFCAPLVLAGSLAASTVDTYTVHTSTENITTALTQSATTR